MTSRLLSRPIVQLAAASLVALSILVSIYPASIPGLSRVSNYAVQFMLFYLLAGLFFLLLKQPRLTFIFFGGSVVLCLFLKYSINNDGIQKLRQVVINRRMVEKSPVVLKKSTFKIAHLNVSNVTKVTDAIATIKASDAGVISIHEVTPQWDQWLSDSLSGAYPYHHTLVDIGLYGMAIYSKYPLEQVDTFYFHNIPNLRGVISIDSNRVGFINTHTEPALNTASKQRLRGHLASIARQTRGAAFPVLVFGEFNAVSWSNEIQVFRDSARLFESRTGFMPYASSGVSSFLDVPLDHIFYSPELDCMSFENLYNAKSNKRLGIFAEFQFKYPRTHAKATAQ